MREDPSAAPDDPAGTWARILAELAHDVRGAAGGADLWLELLVRANDDAGRARAAVELRRAIGRSVRIAEEFGDASAMIAAGAGEPTLPFDLGTAVAAAIRRAAPDSEARRIRIEGPEPAAFVHSLVGHEPGFGRMLDRILAAAIAEARGGTILEVRLAKSGTGGAEIEVPCGTLVLPPDLPLLAAWGRPRPTGVSFPLGLWLARAFLARTGGRLETREESGGRSLVIVTP